MIDVVLALREQQFEDRRCGVVYGHHVEPRVSRDSARACGAKPLTDVARFGAFQASPRRNESCTSGWSARTFNFSSIAARARLGRSHPISISTCGCPMGVQAYQSPCTSTDIRCSSQMPSPRLSSTRTAQLIAAGAHSYVLAAWVMPRARPALPWGVAVAHVELIEVSQLYRASLIDRVRARALGGLVLGHRFLWSDVLCVAFGASLTALVDPRRTRARAVR